MRVGQPRRPSPDPGQPTVGPPPKTERASPRRVALIGAGFIADAHARALRRIDGVDLTAIVEVEQLRKEAFARRWKVADAFASVEQLLEGGSCEAAHVLVPPPRHFEVAAQLLRNGVATFVEKPLATSSAECAALHAAATAGGVSLRVNHNYVHHPVHKKMKRLLQGHPVGPIRHFHCQYNMPLRQLAAGQLSHWMFERPLNLLLEQATHPLSQIDDLFGPLGKPTVLRGPGLRKLAGTEIVQQWAIAIACGARIGQLHLGFGQSYPVWRLIAVGDDGTITADYLRGTLILDRSGRHADLLERWRDTVARTCQIAWQDAKATLGYLSSQPGDRRGDDFLASIVASARAFYDDLAAPRPPIDASGARLVTACEAIAGAAARVRGGPRPVPPRRRHEVLVIGGTGFIGRHVVRALLERRRSVAVLARDVEAVPRLFGNDPVGAFGGSVVAEEALDAAIEGSRTVVNLAPGAGGHPVELRAATVEGARNVAERAAAHGVRHLVHVSSIAALYLGRPDEVVTGDTAVDPRMTDRAAYARAKAEAELTVRAVSRRRDLALTILRPGVVVGADRTPFHSGIGEFNREPHCLGWNRGRNPLPLVLVEDVADAVARVVEAGPEAAGCFNLVGDVRLSAREYIEEVGRALGRPLRYHPRPLPWLYGVEWSKWLLKRMLGRRDAALPSHHDLRSRGLVACFDTSDVKAALGWQPEASKARFIERLLACHA